MASLWPLQAYDLEMLLPEPLRRATLWDNVPWRFRFVLNRGLKELHHDEAFVGCGVGNCWIEFHS
jgi:hypothetical protein